MTNSDSNSGPKPGLRGTPTIKNKECVSLYEPAALTVANLPTSLQTYNGLRGHSQVLSNFHKLYSRRRVNTNDMLCKNGSPMSVIKEA